jgi:hypothetical protein
MRIQRRVHRKEDELFLDKGNEERGTYEQKANHDEGNKEDRVTRLVLMHRNGSMFGDSLLVIIRPLRIVYQIVRLRADVHAGQQLNGGLQETEH